MHGFAIYAVDLQARIIYWPGSAERLYGYSAKEALGKTTRRFLPADDAKALGVVGRMRMTLQRKRFEDVGWRLGKNRKPFFARLISAPLERADGSVAGITVLTQDLTDQSRVEREAMRLAAIVESSGDAIISTNLSGIIQSWNKAAERVLGYTRAEMVGHLVTRLIPPDLTQERRETLEHVAAGPNVRYYETYRLRKDGQRVPMLVTLSPVRDRTGRIVGASKVLHDITELRRTEARLRDSESRFRVTYEHAPIGIEQVALADGQLLDVNRKLCQMLGYQREELTCRRFSDVTHPNDRAAERRLLRALLADEIPSYTIEKRYLHKNGDPVWVRVTSAKAGGHDARAYRISIVEDITEQKRIQLSLLESEQRMRAIVTTAADAVITIDGDGIVQSANPATRRLFGYEESELVGRHVRMLMPEPIAGDRDRFLSEYVSRKAGRNIGTGRDMQALHKTGTTFPIHLSVRDVKLGSDRIFIAIVHDLSERRRLESQILEAGAHEQMRIGQDLHDGLCQELVSIGYTSEILARKLERRSAEEAALARTLGDSIRSVVAQARQLAHGLNPVDVHAGGLQAGLASLTRRISETFNVKCVCDCENPIVLKDDATATHLYRIAQEAIGNAIKHGKARGIQVSLKQVEGQITLSIEDDGRGLPRSVIARLNRLELGAAKSEPDDGMGLRTMMYRARIIGGGLKVSRRQPRGTSVVCSLRKIGPDAKDAGPTRKSN